MVKRVTQGLYSPIVIAGMIWLLRFIPRVTSELIEPLENSGRRAQVLVPLWPPLLINDQVFH
jgi:hypothetical protein